MRCCSHGIPCTAARPLPPSRGKNLTQLGSLVLGDVIQEQRPEKLPTESVDKSLDIHWHEAIFSGLRAACQFFGHACQARQLAQTSLVAGCARASCDHFHALTQIIGGCDRFKTAVRTFCRCRLILAIHHDAMEHQVVPDHVNRGHRQRDAFRHGDSKIVLRPDVPQTKLGKQRREFPVK